MIQFSSVYIPTCTLKFSTLSLLSCSFVSVSVCLYVLLFLYLYLSGFLIWFFSVVRCSFFPAGSMIIITDVCNNNKENPQIELQQSIMFSNQVHDFINGGENMKLNGRQMSSKGVGVRFLSEAI